MAVSTGIEQNNEPKFENNGSSHFSSSLMASINVCELPASKTSDPSLQVDGRRMEFSGFGSANGLYDAVPELAGRLNVDFAPQCENFGRWDRSASNQPSGNGGITEQVTDISKEIQAIAALPPDAQTEALLAQLVAQQGQLIGTEANGAGDVPQPVSPPPPVPTPGGGCGGEIPQPYPPTIPGGGGDVPPPVPTPTPGGGCGGSLDMSSIFTKGDSGVTSQEMQHAIDIANALPADMKQALLSAGVNMQLLSGFQGGPEGENDGTTGDFYVDSGMADQAEVHELYEMYGQVSGNGPGSWADSKAVGLADQAMQGIMSGSARGGDPGDLNDTVGQYQGDGDLMSNAFTADFFATHANLYQDSVGQSVLQATIADAPQLTNYIAQAQGLTDAASAQGAILDARQFNGSGFMPAACNATDWQADFARLAQQLGISNYDANDEPIEF